MSPSLPGEFCYRCGKLCEKTFEAGPQPGDPVKKVFTCGDHGVMGMMDATPDEIPPDLQPQPPTQENVIQE